jgi:hypothetical protein
VALQPGFLRLTGTRLRTLEYVPAIVLRHLAAQFLIGRTGTERILVPAPHDSVVRRTRDRLSPPIHDHINTQGRHSFTMPEAVAKGELRALRNPADDPD